MQWYREEREVLKSILREKFYRLFRFLRILPDTIYRFELAVNDLEAGMLTKKIIVSSVLATILIYGFYERQRQGYQMLDRPVTPVGNAVHFFYYSSVP